MKGPSWLSYFFLLMIIFQFLDGRVQSLKHTEPGKRYCAILTDASLTLRDAIIAGNLLNVLNAIPSTLLTLSLRNCTHFAVYS